MEAMWEAILVTLWGMFITKEKVNNYHVYSKKYKYDIVLLSSHTEIHILDQYYDLASELEVESW